MRNTSKIQKLFLTEKKKEKNSEALQLKQEMTKTDRNLKDLDTI